jgi:hypothetical protein
MSAHLILFAVEDEAYVRVVHDVTPKQLAELVEMVEYRHSPPNGAWTYEMSDDKTDDKTDDDATLIREEYEEAIAAGD